MGVEMDFGSESQVQGESDISSSREERADKRIYDDRQMRLSEENIAELRRMERARGLGLSEDATWEEIFQYIDEEERQGVAAELGLPLESSWRNITAEVLGLSWSASGRQIAERIVELRKEQQNNE